MARHQLTRTAAVVLCALGLACAKEHLALTVPLIDELPRARITAPRSVLVRESNLTVNGETRRCLFMHPVSSAEFNLVVPARAKLVFGVGVAQDVWDKGGDGVEFRVSITEGADETMLFTRYVNPKAHDSDRLWHEEEVDLSLYEGQRISLVFSTDSGPADDPRWDSAGWSNPMIKGMTW